MKTPRLIAFALFACALSVVWLLGIPSLAAAGPVEIDWEVRLLEDGF